MTDRLASLGPRQVLSLAAVATVAALAFAVAPADQDEQVLRFEPARTAESAPTAVSATMPYSVAPLGVARPTVEALDVTLPCDAEGSTFRTAAPPDWYERRGSLRFPDLGNSLQLRVGSSSVVALRGSATIAELDIDAAPGCLTRLLYDDGAWELSAAGESVAGAGGSVRVAEAAFTGPAAVDDRSQVTITTREIGSSPTPLKLTLLVIAVVAGTLATAAVAAVDRSDRLRDGLRWWESIRPVDGVVVAMLALWAVIIPPNLDDGWLASRVGSYATHGDFSNLFAASASRMPFGYWLEWLQHLWFTMADSPLTMRLFPLAVGIATWAMVRGVGRRVGIPGSGGSPWVMATAFIAGFGAWGMTLRAEPAVALLVVASLALAIRFVEQPSAGVLIPWVLVIALAVTAHPAGIIALGPVLATLPELAKWTRSSTSARTGAGVAVLLLVAVTAVLWTIDSSLELQREAVSAFRETSHSGGFLSAEFERYRLFDEAPYGTPMRRLSVGLTAVAIGAFLLRRRGEDRLAAIPAWALVVGMGLLTLTPSKWPWHLGGLLGVLALVVALEVRRLHRSRWVFAVLGIGAAASWVWSVSLQWNVFDLHVERWAEVDVETGDLLPVTTGALPFELTSIVGWVVLAAVLGLVSFAVARLRPDLGVPNPPETAVLLVVGIVLLTTTTTLWSDADHTDGWTFGSQNLDHLLGRETCGLGDEVAVPVPGSLTPLGPGGTSDQEADLAARSAGFSHRGTYVEGGFFETTLNALPPIEGVSAIGSFVAPAGASPPENTGRFISDWSALEPDHDAVGLFILGSFDVSAEAELGNAIAIQWGTNTDAGVADAGVEEAALNDVYIDWTFVEFLRPEGADRVRLLLRDDTVIGGMAWVASTPPLGYSRVPIADPAVADTAQILVAPALAPYFPCVEVPQFYRGIVPVPEMVIQTWNEMWQTTFVGPTSGERWFWYPVALDPPLESEQVGAHTGDARNFLFVSQEYLTGTPARYTGEFERVG